MDSFIDRLYKNSIEFRDKTALSNGGNDIFSYEKVWELSGRVYRYFKENGIGKEDFIMINLPRSAEIVIVCIGAWRAGAAVVIIEEGYPQERTDFIYDDCGCKKKIDKALFDSIMSLEPLDGYEKTDLHDAAYACYTSGSTGLPKGVLHEYGTIGQTIEGFYYDQRFSLNSSDVIGILAPLNFVGVFIFFPAVLYCGGEFLIIPSKKGKNVRMLEEFFFDEKVTIFFSAPSLIKLFERFNPELRLLFCGSDVVKDMYLENIPCVDAYAQSETGFHVTFFMIDRPYENNPIGKAVVSGLDIKVLDEECKEVPAGEVGEICFNNPFFREYINHKDLTEHAKRGGIYHSGDIGKVLEDGNIVLLGRADDMVKICGNRVEPREVERIVKDVLRVEWTFVKCVEYEGKNILVAYFLGEPAVPLAEAREIISLRLPYYMTPSKYIMLDEIPKGPYGKIARSELPDPDFSSVAAYNAPRDDIESKLIRVWEWAFRTKKIGIDDDFYELGGDSILSLEVVSALNIRGFTAEDLFRERTVRKCAEYIRKQLINENETELSKTSKEAAEAGCRLTAYQLFCFDRQCFLPQSRLSTMMNLPLLFRYEKADADKLCDAINKAVMAHPLMLSKIYYDEEGFLCQKYDKTIFEKIKPLRLSEEEFEKRKGSLVKPFNLVNDRLYRIEVFDTGKFVYMFIDVHHIISDGTSLHLLLSDIYKSFRGERLRRDYIYMHLKREESRYNDEYYMECKNYLESAYSNTDWSVIPDADHESKNYGSTFLSRELNFDSAIIKKACKELGSNENAIFMLTTMLTLSEYNNKDNVLITWTYHGRDTGLKKNMFGLLIKDLIIALKKDIGMTVKDAIESVNMQIASGIAHSLYPYSFSNNVSYEKDRLCFLFQQDIYEFPEDKELKSKRIEVDNENLTAENSFSVQIMTVKNKYVIGIDYLKDFYDESSVERFCDIFEEKIKLILRGANEEV